MQEQRYTRLVALNDSSLDVALDTLSISRSIASLPPRKRPTNIPDMFSPFNYPQPAKPVEIQEEPSNVIKPLSRDVVAALFAAARPEYPGIPPREKHKLLRRENNNNPAQQPDSANPDGASMPPRKLHTRRHTMNNLNSNMSQPDNPMASSFRSARSRLPLKRRAQLAARHRRTPGRDEMLEAMSKSLFGSKRARLENDCRESSSDIPNVPGAEPKLVEMVTQEMLEKAPNVQWDDIAGLDFAKSCVKEAVIWPMLRPDIFVGLRGPPKGLLLFGPPGTGKTMIGRAIASQSKAKFFNISASSLLSKWMGESEKTVRALFLTARAMQPSVVFIDEVDSILQARSDKEHESSRRVKTEFLVQMDGAGTSRDDRVLVVGATNRPQELDEAARRRFVKRLYIPLPDSGARTTLINRLLEKQGTDMSGEDVGKVAEMTAGYSGSDLYALCAEAALEPVRELGDRIGSVDAESVRPIRKPDFEQATRAVRASVATSELKGYTKWNDRYGSFAMNQDAAKTDDGHIDPS
ncbi:Fidgetin-like protein 1 [Gracilariopsis chorda]|uniref:Fidgetin-like protein 1 n=1 Tax=Gracilariopsis chorda TaxID=448386 RepID=A0A2V3IWF2_9FLOR|nr:Fidgetin-like protein 1 [Gracilariopsis chorda]|eukprot:PXF46047.1 Fidgetin-like protein 1 [Gracilariopsis chorda]